MCPLGCNLRVCGADTVALHVAGEGGQGPWFSGRGRGPADDWWVFKHGKGSGGKQQNQLLFLERIRWGLTGAGWSVPRPVSACVTARRGGLGVILRGSPGTRDGIAHDL